MLANRQYTLGSPTGDVVDRDTLVKSYLGITGTDENTLLDLWIAAAVTQAEAYCQRFFLQRSVVEKLYGELSSRTLVLTHTPIATLTSIVDADGATVSSSTYDVDMKSGRVIWKDSGLVWTGDYTATYTAGWLAADIPKSIQVAICELVKQARKAKSRDSDVVIEQSPDVGSTTYRGAIPGVTNSGSGPLVDLPPAVQRALMPYRRRWT